MEMKSEWQHFSVEDILGSTQVFENIYVPKGELWMVNRLSEVRK
jgi:hypothetical protein